MKNMKPLIWIIDEEWPDYALETQHLSLALPGCEIRRSGNDFTADLESFGTDADAVICQINIPMTAEVVARLGRCKVISVYGAGYNNVDVAAAREKGITVCNVPGYCVEDVSDYVIAAIYHFNKSLGNYHANIQNGLWGAQAAKVIINRLSASVLMIVGCGRIGKAAAKKAKSLGMAVLAFDPYLSEAEAADCGIEKVGLLDGLARADYVSVHAKLTPETEKLIGGAALAAMKPSAYLINAARGGVIDEAALIAAVSSGGIAGAMLDVVTCEPPDYNTGIFNCPGIFVTPHISYLSVGALKELQLTAAQNAAAVLLGKPQNTVLA